MNCSKCLGRLFLVIGVGISLLAVACSSSPQTASIVVTVSPSTAYVPVGYDLQFGARVTGTTNAAVTWTVGGVVGGSLTNGFITTTGFYQAPLTVPASKTVTVMATSQENGSKSGSATVTIVAQSSGGNTVQVASGQTVSNINVQVVPLTPTLSIYGAGTCSGSTCTTAAAGVQAAQGESTALFLVGAGIVSGTVYSVSGNPGDVTVVQPSGAQFGNTADGTPSVTLNLTVSPTAAPGLRNIMVSNPSTGELSVFVGGLLITPPGS
jgi:hypothetical protein